MHTCVIQSNIEAAISIHGNKRNIRMPNYILYTCECKYDRVYVPIIAIYMQRYQLAFVATA